MMARDAAAAASSSIGSWIWREARLLPNSSYSSLIALSSIDEPVFDRGFPAPADGRIPDCRLYYSDDARTTISEISSPPLRLPSQVLLAVALVLSLSTICLYLTTRHRPRSDPRLRRFLRPRNLSCYFAREFLSQLCMFLPHLGRRGRSSAGQFLDFVSSSSSSSSSSSAISSSLSAELLSVPSAAFVSYPGVGLRLRGCRHHLSNFAARLVHRHPTALSLSNHCEENISKTSSLSQSSPVYNNWPLCSGSGTSCSVSDSTRSHLPRGADSWAAGSFGVCHNRNKQLQENKTYGQTAAVHSSTAAATFVDKLETRAQATYQTCRPAHSGSSSRPVHLSFPSEITSSNCSSRSLSIHSPLRRLPAQRCLDQAATTTTTFHTSPTSSSSSPPTSFLFNHHHSSSDRLPRSPQQPKKDSKKKFLAPSKSRSSYRHLGLGRSLLLCLPFVHRSAASLSSSYSAVPYSPSLRPIEQLRTYSNTTDHLPPSTSKFSNPPPPSPVESAAAAARDAEPDAASVMSFPTDPAGVSSKSMDPPHLITDNLEKPLLDNRTYRVIQLPNKVEVLLVHDDTTDKSSAALDVRVGSMSDDPELPGQAHAVEHVLFMGTKKYPGENDYMSFLANHSGSSNAYTSALSTNYYFEVSHKFLYDALDRFSQFFIAPLFDPNGLDRELNAVDSEHKKNLQQDNYRSYQLGKYLSNPNHPYSKFTTGNLETLRDEPKARGVDVRDRFMKFHERYYSGNLMKLTVLGRESLDELEKWVLELFSDIKNKDLPAPTFQGSPLSETELGTQYYLRPVMESRSLTYTFPYMDEDPYYEAQPSRYIGHLIGHEGPGSILSVLKEAGIATSLSAGHMRICNDTGMYVVNIRLTISGMQKIPEITALLFSYINILNSTEPQEWVVKELQAMAEVEFRYKQKSNNAGNFASGMASTMQNSMPREYLLSEHKIRKFDAALIKKGLSYLRPDNFRLAIATPELPEGLTWESKERWYGVEYTLQKIPAEVLDLAVKSFNGEKPPSFEIPGGKESALHLPHPNPFIPTNFDVHRKEVDQPRKVPELLKNTNDARIWFKKDDTFWAPKAYTFFTVRTPTTYTTPRDYALSRFFCELVKDALHEYYYDAELAGLYYVLSPNMLGFDLEIGGYNDKMIVLLTKVLQAMKDLEVKEGRYEVIRERLIRAYRNWELGTPYQMVPEFTRHLLAEKKWLNEEILTELESFTGVDEILAWWKGVNSMSVEGMIHGNLYKEDALNMAGLFQQILKPKPLSPSQWFMRRNVLLPPGSEFIFERDLRDPNNVNNAVEYMLHLGSSEDRQMKAKLLLWAQMSQERAFDTLRTKEQLGYVVFSGSLMQATTMGYRVLVQSERSCAYLEQRIEAFLSLDWEMDDSAFEKHKQSVLNRLQESLKNLNQESNRLWWHVASEAYDFLQIDHDVANVSLLTKQDMMEFYQTYIKPGSPTRAKLSVHLKSVAKKDAADAAAINQNNVYITDVSAWKAGLTLSRGPRPVRPLEEMEKTEVKL